MRHVSEIVLSKLRTSKKSGNLTIDFDPKKLEYPPNKVFWFLQNNDCNKSNWYLKPI